MELNFKERVHKIVKVYLEKDGKSELLYSGYKTPHLASIITPKIAQFANKQE